MVSGFFDNEKNEVIRPFQEIVHLCRQRAPRTFIGRVEVEKDF